MNIINVSIAVIVKPITGRLAWVGPDAGGQPRVVVIDARVDNGNSLARARKTRPCRLEQVKPD